MDLPSPYFFPLYFVAWWCFVVYVISLLSGWRQLAGNYRFEGAFTGKRWRFRSISMRWGAGYGSCVHIGADTRGLYLSILFLFRPGHPSLFIPWSDISVREVRYWGVRRWELRFKKCGTVPVRIRPALGQLLAETAGDSWPAKNTQNLDSGF
jgi:hypothetical protein